MLAALLPVLVQGFSSRDVLQLLLIQSEAVCERSADSGQVHEVQQTFMGQHGEELADNDPSSL